MYFENVDDFHKEIASFLATVDERQDIPHLHLRLSDHLHPEFLAKRQRMGMSNKNNIKWINYIIYQGLITRNTRYKLTAEPGFIGVAPGRGVITWPPVSVCQNVSDILHLALPMRL